MTRTAAAGVVPARAPWPLGPWVATAAGAFLLLIAWQRLFHLAPIDDAYIFLRYVRNWTAGLGPVFNAGARVEGFSSPLWLALLVPGQLAAPGSTWLALVAGALCAALTIATVVAALLRARVVPWLAWLAGAWLVTSPGLVYWAGSGMDTALFTLLVCSALLVLGADLERGRIGPGTGVLIALGCLARMEGLLVLAVAAGFAWVRRRGLGWRWLLLPVATCAVGLVARRLYYGDWLPNTYYAKVAGAGPVVITNGLRYLATLAPSYGLFLAAAALAVIVARTSSAVRPFLPCLVFVALWLADVVWTGGDHFAMGRLVQPLVPLLLVATVAALASPARRADRPRTAALALILVALPVTSVLEWRNEGPRARSEMTGATRWRALGEWLAPRLAPDAWIAAVPIGGIGMGSGRPILDLTGLTDPEIAKRGAVDPHGQPGHLKYHTDMVLERAPAVVFLNFGWKEPGRFQLFPGYNTALTDLLSRPRTISLYRMEVHEFTPGTFAHFLVRRDLPPLAHP